MQGSLDTFLSNPLRLENCNSLATKNCRPARLAGTRQFFYSLEQFFLASAYGSEEKYISLIENERFSLFKSQYRRAADTIPIKTTPARRGR